MRKLKIYIIFVVLLFIYGCTAGRVEDVLTWGKPAKISCWSGGKLILAMESTGQISKSIFSNHYFFKDKQTDRFIEISGDCLIIYPPWSENILNIFNKQSMRVDEKKTMGRFTVERIK